MNTLSGQVLAAIAAGVEAVWTAPVALQVVALQATLGTSAVDGERTPFIVVAAGGSSCVVSGTPRGQPKSTAVQYQWGFGHHVSGPMGAATSIPLSGPLILPAGATLSTYTVGGQGLGDGLDVADQWAQMTWLFSPL